MEFHKDQFYVPYYLLSTLMIFHGASDVLFSILFADDTTVLIEAHSYNNIITILNNELYKIDTWLRANKLTININKTHYIVFHRARLKSTKDVMIKQNKIAFTKSTKFLGIIIDDKLKWTEHINYVKKITLKQLYY